MRVRKAVFPAAGWGTRFLPATKAQPKEMLPLVDKPVIQYAVEEAVEAGIEQVIIITSSQKRAIEDHFDLNLELEQLLESRGDIDMLRQIRAISDLAQISYVRQKEQLGLGHAVLVAKELIGHEPFAVILSDDVVGKDHRERFVADQLLGHQDRVAQTELFLLAHVGNLSKIRDGPNLTQHVDVAARLEQLLELEVQVEVVLDRPLLATGDDDDLLDSGIDRFFDRVLDYRFVDERQHLLWLGLGGRKEAGSPTRCGKDDFSNAHPTSAQFRSRRALAGRVYRPA